MLRFGDEIFLLSDMRIFFKTFQFGLRVRLSLSETHRILFLIEDRLSGQVDVLLRRSFLPSQQFLFNLN